MPVCFEVYGEKLSSRLLLGTAHYPSLQVLERAIRNSATALITLGLRRQSPGQRGGAGLWDKLKNQGVRLLPNTAGCHNAREAVALAHMARELFDTRWVKLEVIADDYTLAPHPAELVDAARILAAEDFCVFPYCTEDCALGERLLEAGCQLLMPWASPIGTGRGIAEPGKLKLMRERFPDIPLIVDAGLGSPAHVVAAMELGYDAVLINTAVARAADPAAMAHAMRMAVEVGRMGFKAGIVAPRAQAEPSTPMVGRPFWHYANG